jgi:glutamate synthase domain-containing protein 3
VQVGLIASEKQAIDATLLSLSKDDKRICPVADRYWNARGGSHEDGGSFIFNLKKDTAGRIRIDCTDKFGMPVPLPGGTEGCDFTKDFSVPSESRETLQTIIGERFVPGNSFAIYEMIRDLIPDSTYDEISLMCRQLLIQSRDASKTATAIEVFTLLNDRRYSMGSKKRSHVLHIMRTELNRLLSSLPRIGDKDAPKGAYRLVDFPVRDSLRGPQAGETVLAIDAAGFAPEGENCDAELLVDAYMKGWRKFICFNCIGQRYTGCGLGPDTDEVTIDVFGSSGDYLSSGIDGLTITVHGNAQDQLGQIFKRGKLVIHGDVGQTFMYGAKGGEVYVLGNAAGRPLINSVGRPKVVINGTCLDFLAESFMAGDPLNGGGFVVLNGLKLDDAGRPLALTDPYPGSNLFSLASGGAIYVRDPERTMVDQQLNGGQFAKLTDADWELILPFLEENQRLFGITVKDLLTVGGKQYKPCRVYRKVVPGNVKDIVLEDTDDVWADEPYDEQAAN